MHNGQAQLRAIESGRYVVRAANTGISTIISDRGEVLALQEPLVDGMVVGDVYLSDSQTLYTRIGNLWIYVLISSMILYLLWEGLLIRRRRTMRAV